MSAIKHVLIIELANSHDECIYSQVLFLIKGNHKVSMLLSSHAFENTKSFHHLCQHVEKRELENTFSGHQKQIKEIKSLSKSWGVDTLVFNTAQGSFVRDFCIFSLFFSKKVLGILHSIKKLDSSFTQKFISLKIRNYFLLSDILRSKIAKDKQKHVDVFYPLFFDYSKSLEPFDQDTFNIVLSGGVESRRKDLDGFIELFKKNEVPSHWNIIFAGKSDPKSEIFLKLDHFVKEHDLSEQFSFYHDFIPTETFFEIISTAHVILPLIHPNTPSHDEYMKRQISGAFNLAYGFRVPLMIHEKFSNYEEFIISAFFYSLETLVDKLKEIDGNRSLLTEKRKSIETHEMFSFEKQQKNYLNVIES